jgi:predicted ester cyclase
VKEAVAHFRTAFPDLRFELQDVVSDRDRPGPARGRRIVELWAQADGDGLFEQLTV